MDTLENLIQVLAMDTELMSMVNEVGHMRVGQGIELPYVIVTDVSSRYDYAFDGDGIDSSLFFIEACASLEGETISGQTATKNILERIRNILQDGEDTFYTDGGAVLCCRRRGRTPSHVLTRSGNEQYLMRGHEWEIVSEENVHPADDSVIDTGDGFLVGDDDALIII